MAQNVHSMAVTKRHVPAVFASEHTRQAQKTQGTLWG